MDDIFRITKDALGNPVYTHNNETLSKDVFDQRRQTSNNEQTSMRSAMTPGIDDDPEIMAMKEKVKAMAAAGKPQKKADGGSINKTTKISTHQKNPKNSNW
jgi:hypothetical protein